MLPPKLDGPDLSRAEQPAVFCCDGLGTRLVCSTSFCTLNTRLVFLNHWNRLVLYRWKGWTTLLLLVFNTKCTSLPKQLLSVKLATQTSSVFKLTTKFWFQSSSRNQKVNCLHASLKLLRRRHLRRRWGWAATTCLTVVMWKQHTKEHRHH